MVKKCLSLLLTGVLLVAMTGCAEKQETTEESNEETQKNDGKEEEPEEEEQPKEDSIEIEIPEGDSLIADYTTAAGIELPPSTRIAVVAKNAKSNYWKAVRTGMEEAVADLNEEAGLEGDEKITMTFEAPGSEDDAEEQINIVDAVLAENPQALCLAAIDAESLGAQLETAGENGIPVIGFDSGVDGAASEELIGTMCETDNYEAGAEAARRLAAAVGDFGEVLVAASTDSSESVSERVLGFEGEIQNEHKTVTVVDTIYANDEEDIRDLGERAREILDAHPNLKGCFVTDENMAEEMLNILDEEEYQDIQLVGFDAGEKQLNAIREGSELGTVCQNPYGMGYAAVIAAARAIMGLENEEVIDAGYQWIDQSNIDLAENQKYLYE
ncbi:MAG: substrate-binding domain-containing protein [Ruminococcus sp.]|jgi:ribose transport system substrate-binding protein